MKVFKKGFKPTVKFVIVFLAVALASYLLFKDVLKESFTDAKYRFAGMKFEGALSSIYDFFTNTDPTKNLPVVGDQNPGEAFSSNETFALFFKDPKMILGSYVDKNPKFKCCIIDTSNDKVIYDPITEYKNTKTMSPFPNTTTVGTYIIYLNMVKVDPPDSTGRPPYKLCTSTVDNNSVINMFRTMLIMKEEDYIELRKPEVKNGSVINAKRQEIGAKMQEVRESPTYDLFPLGNFLRLCAVIKNINFISFAYEDCEADSFQNLEGFASFNKIYDSNGTVISSAAILSEKQVEETKPEEKKPEEKKPEEKPAASSNYTTPLIIASVAIVGGGGMILLMRSLVPVST